MAPAAARLLYISSPEPFGTLALVVLLSSEECKYYAFSSGCFHPGLLPRLYERLDGSAGSVTDSSISAGTPQSPACTTGTVFFMMTVSDIHSCRGTTLRIRTPCYSTPRLSRRILASPLRRNKVTPQPVTESDIGSLVKTSQQTHRTAGGTCGRLRTPWRIRQTPNKMYTSLKEPVQRCCKQGYTS